MTDKEMAEEYCNTHIPVAFTYLIKKKATRDKIENLYSEELKQAFLAGLKAGRPEWHDLREDPNDLPNVDKVVLNQVGMATRYDPNRGFLGLDGIGVIAWCEIPKYTEE